MAHLNYNHLYYFWMLVRKGSLAAASEALCVTPQTISGQLKLLEGRMGPLLTKRGRRLDTTELGRMVFRYADRMFNLSYELIDILDYQKHESVRFDVGVADALSKWVVAQLLRVASPPDMEVALSCFESRHELLLDELKSHKLDMIVSDCPIDSAAEPGLHSRAIADYSLAFFCRDKLELPFPFCLEERPLLLPSRKTAAGRELKSWLDEQGLNPTIGGEFDDSGLMQAFGAVGREIFVAPAVNNQQFEQNFGVHCLGETDAVKERYYVIFAERMIQHPAVARLCNLEPETLRFHSFFDH
ncbi:transcriptional activator NhaR [Gallaecimonas pentaromativorans]|uniref:transcriptional activator NhaR n=1 Tax=Gallaecimonas pentaromativorans TaxID=584787 RepID=UPI00067EA8D2|nr:transcriptional activator NhaR [Gallaecimonas pentaromativorans]MED5523963.1 transcriptional activator NhaR [Pseudomonadota bacterium]